jgi:hypothetical protein
MKRTCGIVPTNPGRARTDRASGTEGTSQSTSVRRSLALYANYDELLLHPSSAIGDTVVDKAMMKGQELSPLEDMKVSMMAWRLHSASASPTSSP